MLFFSSGILNFWLPYKDVYADVVAKDDLVLFNSVNGLLLYIIFTDRPP